MSYYENSLCLTDYFYILSFEFFFSEGFSSTSTSSTSETPKNSMTSSGSSSSSSSSSSSTESNEVMTTLSQLEVVAEKENNNNNQNLLLLEETTIKNDECSNCLCNCNGKVQESSEVSLEVASTSSDTALASSTTSGTVSEKENLQKSAIFGITLDSG